MIGTLFGVTMFLVLLLFAVQVTAHLHASTVVGSATFDAARLASASDAADAQCRDPSAAALDRATAHLHALLGALGDAAEVSWQGTTGTDVVLTVAVRSPARVIGGTGAVVGMDRIQRTVRLRRECAS